MQIAGTGVWLTAGFDGSDGVLGNMDITFFQWPLQIRRYSI
jgi:hypothetical protein